MIRFVEVFRDIQIVQSMIGQLGQTHFHKLIYLDNPLKRDFYAEVCRLEIWNTRTLHQKIAISVPIQATTNYENYIDERN